MDISKPHVNDYLSAAKRGSLVAQKQLGMLLVRSDNSIKDGIRWLEKATKQGDADAMYLLGRVCLTKLNDPKKAFRWYEKAAKNNHVDAMIDVGAFYVFGYVVSRNVEEAIKWYKRAANLNSPVGYHNLAFLYLQDEHLYNTAIQYLEKAKSLGYSESAYMLGVIYFSGRGVEKNAEYALDNLVLSYDLGKYYSCRPIGDLYFQGAFDNGQQNCCKAIEWYSRGAEHGVLSCVEVLGDIYYYGFGVETDFCRALNFYKQAAEMGSGNAAFTLGSMFIGGEGTAQDLKEALKWMLLAEKKGHDRASKFVNMLLDVLDDGKTAHAGPSTKNTVSIKLRSSYSESVEKYIAEQERENLIKKKRNASIYAAAGAHSGNGSYTDYDMGAVINPDGRITYVDTDLGVILGSDGSVSSHDSATGVTFNWGSGNMMAYDEVSNATLDINSGSISYNFDGYTIK